MITVLVGNPKPASRTLHAATLIAERIEPGVAPRVIDIATLGADVLDPRSDVMVDATHAVSSSDLLVVACPTYKASFTGLLKVFLDALPGGGLSGVTALPVMLGAGPHHALAPEFMLRPVLSELGASCPVGGLYLLDSAYEDSKALDEWLERVRAFTVRGAVA